MSNSQPENNVLVSSFTTSRQFSGEVPDAEEIIDISSLGKALTLECERKTLITKNLATKFLEMRHVSYERG